MKQDEPASILELLGSLLVEVFSGQFTNDLTFKGVNGVAL
jgi:hypothetical protein